MEVTNFRLGNIVGSGTTPLDWEMVIAIFPHKIVTDLRGLGGMVESHRKPEDIEVIPLTEEWLVKLGFENVQDVFYRCKYGWFRINLECAGKKGFYFRSIDGYMMELKYAHQLQNLFYDLTGDELTIKA